MLGFPWETKKHFLNTVNFGKSLKCDWTLYSCLTPFPGSKIYEELAKNSEISEDIKNDYEHLDFRSYVLEPEYVSNEFVSTEAYFANLDQNFIENPNLVNGKEEVALSDFKNVIKLSPDHATAYYCIGRIYESKNNEFEAQRFFRLAAENMSGLHKKSKIIYRRNS